MSVVLDRPVTDTQTAVVEAPVKLRPTIVVEPTRRPVVDIPVPKAAPAPTPTRQKTRSVIAHGLLVKTILFVGVFGLTCVSSTMAGQFMVEQSRTQSIEALGRSRQAVKVEKAIQRRLDVLRSAAAIEDWALSHGFRPSDGLGQTSKVQDSAPTHK